MVSLERACEGGVVSTRGRCLEHQKGGEKERIEKELEPGTVNALRAVGWIVAKRIN